VSDLHPTLTRRKLLTAVQGGRIRRTQKGNVIHADGALNRRADAAIREVEAAGWVRLGPDGGTYELTDDGRNVIGGGP
jgi:hypothetical protein